MSLFESVSVPEESSEFSAPEPAETDLPTFPVGQMGFTKGRLAYEDGDMWLILPRLGLQESVYTDVLGDVEDLSYDDFGVTDASLTKGICLFGTAALPGEAVNTNTSLAGHRDIGGKEFYYLDTVEDGDLAYLDYNGNRYTYLYESTSIVDIDDWEEVRAKDYSRLTLQTCTPIGKASHRMFVVYRLIEVTPLDQIDASQPPAATVDELEGPENNPF